MKTQLTYEEARTAITEYLEARGWTNVTKVILHGTRRSKANPDGLGGHIEVEADIDMRARHIESVAAVAQSPTEKPATAFNAATAEAESYAAELDELMEEEPKDNVHQLDLDLSHDEEDAPWEEPVAEKPAGRPFKRLFGKADD